MEYCDDTDNFDTKSIAISEDEDNWVSGRTWSLGSLHRQAPRPLREQKRAPSTLYEDEITPCPISPMSGSSVITEGNGNTTPSSRSSIHEIRHDPLGRFHQYMATWAEGIPDHGVLTAGVIVLSIWVAAICGTAAFCLHLAVEFAGCLGGVNGCHKTLLYDLVEPYGIGKSLFFVITSCLSGLVCSLIIYSPCKNRVALKCRSGGSAGTKIIIGAGKSVSAAVPLLRIILAAIYMGGGNTLGTEGPIIHLTASLATFLISALGIKSRKMLSMFAVVGAAAGISAGFNVIITGFIFTIEELTRSLSQKSALIITLSAAVATVVKGVLEILRDSYLHLDHHSHLVPEYELLSGMTAFDLYYLYLLAVPIGILNGVAGWIFARWAWSIQSFFNPKAPNWYHRRLLPVRAHLAIVGLLSALLGVLVYEVTGINAVWGTTVGAIPETLKAHAGWPMVLLMFAGKFVAMTFATAVGGPGGTLVPSLAAGGLIGIIVAQIAGCNDQTVAACAVIGMGSLFASIMHMPITGVIMMFELTWAKELIVHVIIGNFIASNVVHRLPLGHLSFVHRVLEHDPLWLKLGGQDFIENDRQARIAFYNEGIGKIIKFETFAIKWWLLTELEKQRLVFQAWWKEAERNWGRSSERRELRVFTHSHRKLLHALINLSMETTLRYCFGAWVLTYIQELKRAQPTGDDRRTPWVKPLLGDEQPPSGYETESQGGE